MRFALSILLVMFMGGCSAGHVAPVEDIYGQSSRPSKVTSGSHQVRKGETLYSIAWRYGWDYRSLARANGIKAPYTIYPGQRISLRRPKPKPAKAAASPTKTQMPSQPADKSRQESSKQPEKPENSEPTPQSATASPEPEPSEKKASPKMADDGWIWPADGKLLQRFSSSRQGRGGIVLGGSSGEPVVAAAPGRVVYRGSGLTGYGNLLIIKHSERWLSAYAHNDKILVKEGDSVNAGQQVAAMGASGTFRTQLHFEIRRDGKPVDPLDYLPKR